MEEDIMTDYNWIFESQDPLSKHFPIRRLREAKSNVDTSNYSSSSNSLESNPMGIDTSETSDEEKREIAERASAKLERGLKFLQDDVAVLKALSTLVEEFAKKRDEYVADVDPRYVEPVVENPEWSSKIAFKRFAATKLQRVGSSPRNDQEIRSAAAEDWFKSQGQEVPDRDSDAWLNMYESWLLEMLEGSQELNSLMEGRSNKISRLF